MRIEKHLSTIEALLKDKQQLSDKVEELVNKVRDLEAQGHKIKEEIVKKCKQ